MIDRYALKLSSWNSVRFYKIVKIWISSRNLGSVNDEWRIRYGPGSG